MLIEKKKPISVASRKAKARRLQQLVCQELSNLTGIPWGKDELIASREMGQCGVDVRLIGKALKLIQLSVECKYQESWNVHSWILQAQMNNVPETEWLLVAKRNRTSPVVFMDFWAFLRMFEVVLNHRKKELKIVVDPPKPVSRLVKRWKTK